MQSKPRKSVKRTNALTNPTPEFVSLVKAAATHTPYRRLKAAENTEATMAIKQDTHDIARIVFKGDTFADEAAVGAWLEAGGYTGYVVAKAEDGAFTVEDAEVLAAGGDIDTVTLDGGVTLFLSAKAVAVVAAEAPMGVEGAGDTAAQVVAATPVQKAALAVAEGAATVGGWLAAKAAAAGKLAVKAEGTPSLGSEMANYIEWYGLPPAFYDLQDALRWTICANVAAGNMEGVRAAGADFGAMVADLTTFFLAGEGDEAVAQRAAVVAALSEPLTPPPVIPHPVDVTVEAPAVEAPAANAPAVATVAPVAPAPVAAPVEVAKENAAPALAVVAPEAAPAPAVMAAAAQAGGGDFAALTALVATAVKAATDIATAAQATAAKAEAAITELAQRMDEGPGQRQVRKGADVDDVTANNTAPASAMSEDSKFVREVRMRSVLGMGMPRR